MRLFNKLNSSNNIIIEVLYLTIDQNRKWNSLISEADYSYNNFSQISWTSKLTLLKKIFHHSRKNKLNIILCTDFNKIITILFISFIAKNYRLWITIYDNYKIKNNFVINFIGLILVKILIFRTDFPLLSYSKNIKKLTKGKKVIIGSQFFDFKSVYGEKNLSLRKNFKHNFLIISYLNSRKGIIDLIKLFNKYPKLKLFIAGSGNEYFVNKLKEKSADNIKFLGHKEPKEKKELFESSDFFIFHTNKDTWGQTIMESLYNGLPVIGSLNAMASRDLIVNNKNGFTYGNLKELDLILKKLNDNGNDLHAKLVNKGVFLNNDEKYLNNILRFLS
jgi:hypothetical protein